MEDLITTQAPKVALEPQPEPTDSVFLSAEWRNLLLVTYAIDPKLLERYLPKGIELDTIDGRAFVSLVAFEFKNTRLKGIKVPFHVNFPEVNLRFYVKRGSERGVVFIREIVNKPAISIVANTLYNEQYRTRPIRFSKQTTPDGQRFEYRILAGGRWQNIRFSVGDIASELPPADSLEHFFKEHDRGFGATRAGDPLAYPVWHPYWKVYENLEYDLSGADFGALFGGKWTFLNNQQPYHAMAAVGSRVKIYNKE